MSPGTQALHNLPYLQVTRRTLLSHNAFLGDRSSPDGPFIRTDTSTVRQGFLFCFVFKFFLLFRLRRVLVAARGIFLVVHGLFVAAHGLLSSCGAWGPGRVGSVVCGTRAL